MVIPSFELEKRLWRRGYRYVAGIDEVGRGAWAGPVVMGAVVWQRGQRVCGMRDSKMINHQRRERLAKIVLDRSCCCAVGEASVEEILVMGLAAACNLAAGRALDKLECKPDFLLSDAYKIKWKEVKGEGVIKGDQKSISVAAASILAKVYRDKLMRSLHRLYLRYGFARHKGYGTKFHQGMIDKYGLTAQHRIGYKCFDKYRTNDKN